MPGLNLHIFLTRATYESRFLREASSLVRSGSVSEVVLAALWDRGLSEREDVAGRIVIRRLKLATRCLPKGMPWHLLRGLEWQARVVRLAGELRPRTLHAHSLYALPAARTCRRKLGIPLVYDAHELETERNGLRGTRQRIEKRIECRLIKFCDAVLAVSDGIADWYAQTYGIERPTVVRNVPDVKAQALPEGSQVLRERFGIPERDLIFLYQGGLFPGRRVEQFLEVWQGVAPNRHLVFMGYGELAEQVRAAAAKRSNVHYLEAVPPSEVLRHTASADVGLVGVENTCLSYYLCLPNKLFEYLHAGIGCLAPDYPELRKVITEHGCGWLVEEGTAAWRQAVNELLPATIAKAKARAAAAREHFTWTAEEAKLLRVYAKLLEPSR